MIFNSLRVYITEQCNAKCNTCFNRETRSSAIMDISHFETICKYFSVNGIKRIKIMGGEPTIHPQYKQFMKIAQAHFENVFLFTNSINDKLFDFIPRDSDSIIYNFTFHKIWSIEKLMLDKPGKRAFEIQIRKDTNEDEIINYVKSVYTKQITCVLTLDCTANIFKERTILIKKINKLQTFFNKEDINSSMDHRLPLCFLYNSNIETPIDNFSKCSLSCSCLIDADYNLRFCNQTSDKTVNIFSQGQILPIQIIENILQKEFFKRQISNLDKICDSCVFYGRNCNGGCFMNNNIISKADIIHATEFPTI